MAESLQQLLVTNFGLSPSGYTGSQGEVGYVGSAGTNGYTGSAGASGTGILISNIQVTDSGYTVLDDTAVDVAGGYIKITGSGFASGCSVLINQTAATSVTFVSSTEVRAQVPATAAGTYIVYVVNTSGDVAIRVNGVTFSATPTWVTGSGLSGQSSEAISIQLSASTATTYALQAGSSLPAGLTLSNVGLISGTITGISSDTTYNFTVVAIDAENQDSPRSFTLGISVSDPYFMYTTLLLSGNGTNNATNNTFTDSSTNNFAITRNGNVFPGTFTPYGPNWSNYFDGTGDYLSVPDNAVFSFGTGNFTIECWAYVTQQTANQYYGLFCKRPLTSSQGWLSVNIRNNVAVLAFASSQSGGWGSLTTGNLNVPLNTWTHIAVSRSGSSLRLFVNGVVDTGASITTSAAVVDTTSPFFIGTGTSDAGGEFFQGYISNLRVVKGTAVYTSAFTPGTTPLTAIANTSLLTCADNRFIDDSANNFSITKFGDVSVQRFSPFGPSDAYSASATGSSTYIDGSTSSYLSLTTTTAFTLEAIALATYNWTIEAWVYRASGVISIFDCRTGGDYSNWVLAVSDTGNLDFVVSDPAYRFTTTTGKVLSNQWNHVALVHTESTYTYYINGVASGTKSFYGQGPWQTLGRVAWIGRTKDPQQSTGYISDFRFVKGSAVYTAAFTPPTAPLTAISGTVFFLNSNGGGVVDSAMQNNLQTVGDAKISTTQSKFGGSSMYFDGTGDWLFMPPNRNNDLGTGNFTIEMWIYPTAALNTFRMLMAKATNTDETYISLSAGGTGGQLDVYGGSIVFNLNNSISINTWAHLAIVRVGNTWTAYVNGTSLGSVTSSLAFNLSGTYGTYIGRYGQSPAYEWNGYIDDLRITKGIARYAANFTPITTAFLGQ